MPKYNRYLNQFSFESWDSDTSSREIFRRPLVTFNWMTNLNVFIFWLLLRWFPVLDVVQCVPSSLNKFIVTGSGDVRFPGEVISDAKTIYSMVDKQYVVYCYLLLSNALLVFILASFYRWASTCLLKS